MIVIVSVVLSLGLVKAAINVVKFSGKLCKSMAMAVIIFIFFSVFVLIVL